MRARAVGRLTGIGSAWIAGFLLFGASGAYAEAPFFYDPLGEHIIYDPEFYPLNRSAGLLSLIGQAWSRPDEGPGQSPFTQDYHGEYRFLWVASLDPAYSLLVELKGSDRDNLVEDDYFLKSEFLYQGLEAPLFPYAGIRLPEDADFLFYGGLESMSYAVDDFIPNRKIGVPVAVRGWAELRIPSDSDLDPSLRLMGMAHSLEIPHVPDLVLSAGIDAIFNETKRPRWLLEGHAEYTLGYGFVRWVIMTGYALDLDTEEQRASVGLKAELF